MFLPKWRGFCNIGLIELFWKVLKKVMDEQLSVIQLHDCLHGFIQGRDMGKATTKVKLVQQLAYLDQAPLYRSFIDLRKAYNTMNQERCVKIF